MGLFSYCSSGPCGTIPLFFLFLFSLFFRLDSFYWSLVFPCLLLYPLNNFFKFQIILFSSRNCTWCFFNSFYFSAKFPYFFMHCEHSFLYVLEDSYGSFKTFLLNPLSGSSWSQSPLTAIFLENGLFFLLSHMSSTCLHFLMNLVLFNCILDIEDDTRSDN